MDNETEREGITLGEIWRMIKKRLWIILVITLIAGVAAYLFVKLLVDPSEIFYTMEFALNYPGKEELKYPDGTPFYYQDMVSVEMLERAKASSAEFANVDVNKLASEDAITITYTLEGKEAEDVEQYRETYTLKVSQKDFANRELATKFLRAVAETPVQYVKERANSLDYSLALETYEGAYSFGDRIRLLTSERSRILEQYEDWVSIFDESYQVNGRALKDHRADVEILLSDDKREELSRQLTVYGYVPLERLSERLAQLNADHETNDKKIAEIELFFQGSKGGVSSESLEAVAQTYADLKIENVDIERKIQALTEENIKAFDEMLDGEYEKLQQAAEQTKQVASALYSQETRATFSTSRAVQEGGSSMPLITIGAAVVAFLVASAIVCAVEYPKLRAKREEQTKEPAKEEN